MQQRFCDCGYGVWVHYQFLRSGFNRIVFRSTERTEDVLTRCPCCGKRLDIDHLH